MKNIKTFAFSCALLLSLFSFQSANAVEIILSGEEESVYQRLLLKANGELIKEHDYQSDCFSFDTDNLSAGLYNIKSVASWDNSERLTGRLLVSEQLPNGYLFLKISDTGFIEVNTFGDEQTLLAITSDKTLQNVEYKHAQGETLLFESLNPFNFLVVKTMTTEPFFIPLFEGERQISSDELIAEIVALVSSSLRSDGPAKAAKTMKEIMDIHIDPSLIGQVTLKMCQQIENPMLIGQLMIELSKSASMAAPAFMPPPPPPAPILVNPIQVAPKPDVKRFVPAAQQQQAGREECANQLLAKLAERNQRFGNFEIAEHPAVLEENAKIDALIQDYKIQFNAQRSSKDLLKLNISQEKARLEIFRDQNKETYKRLIVTLPKDPLILQYKDVTIRIKALARMLAS
jgi:hypothetical protein